MENSSDAQLTSLFENDPFLQSFFNDPNGQFSSWITSGNPIISNDNTQISQDNGNEDEHSSHSASSLQLLNVVPKPKRRKVTKNKIPDRVKVACLPCQKAKAKCDAQRPCSRCIKASRTELCTDRRLDMVFPVVSQADNVSTLSTNAEHSMEASDTPNDVLRIGKRDIVIEKQWIQRNEDSQGLNEANVEILVQRFKSGECFETTAYLQRVFKEDPKLARKLIMKDTYVLGIILGYVARYHGKDSVQTFKNACLKIAANFPDNQDREVFMKNVIEADSFEPFVAPIIVAEDMGMTAQNAAIVKEVFNVEDIQRSDLAVKRISCLPQAQNQNVIIEQTTVNRNFERLTGFKMKELEAAVQNMKTQDKKLIPNPTITLLTPESQLLFIKYSLKISILEPESVQMFPVSLIRGKSNEAIQCAGIMFAEEESDSCYLVLKPLSALFNPFVSIS